MKNSNDIIGNQIWDLLACSAVPQPTMSPCAPLYLYMGGNIIVHTILLTIIIFPLHAMCILLTVFALLVSIMACTFLQFFFWVLKLNITVTHFFHIELNSDVLLCMRIAVRIQIR